MREFKILEFSTIDFPFGVEKVIHKKNFPLHSHDFVELELITGGSASHILDGNTYHVSEGAILITLPHFIHELKDVKQLELYSFKFDINKLIQLNKDIEKLAGFQALFLFHPMQQFQQDYINKIRLSKEQLTFASMLCEVIFQEWQTKITGFEETVVTYFVTLVTYLSRNFLTHATFPMKYYEIINTTVYIHEHLDSRLTVAELSSLVCLSPRQYTRRFHNLYGVAPMEYVYDCRLALACRMIRNTIKSITEISVCCGFSDKVSFSRLFKKNFGMTPGEYRKSSAPVLLRNSHTPI